MGEVRAKCARAVELLTLFPASSKSTVLVSAQFCNASCNNCNMARSVIFLDISGTDASDPVTRTLSLVSDCRHIPNVVLVVVLYIMISRQMCYVIVDQFGI